MKTFTVGPWNRTFRSRLAGGLSIGALLLGTPAFSAAEEAGAQDAPKEAPQDATKGPAPPPTNNPAPPPTNNPGAASLPEGILARLNGRDIGVDEYASYLLASLGRSKLDEYLDRLLVEEEAKRLEITVPADAVETSVAERIDRILKSVYKGQEEAYLANLSRRRSSLEEEKAKLRQEMYYDILRDQVILKTRQATEADVQREFDEVYGEGGVRYTLRHILVAARPAGVPAQPRPGEEGAKTTGPRTRADAKARAEAVLKELQAGGDFAQAVKQYSDDALTKKNDGRIPIYRKEYLGEDFHKAVSQLGPESPLSGIVESPRGFHIIQLVERKISRLEDVKAELEKAVKEEPPTPKERLDLVARLRAGAKIEGL